MNKLTETFTPFLTKTTAIMSAVIILMLIGAYLVATEKKINRKTVEKFLKQLKIAIAFLIGLEALSGFLEFLKYIIKAYKK